MSSNKSHLNNNKIAVIGNCYLDEIFILSTFPEPDEKIIAKDLKITLGGGASNTSSAFAKLGLESYLISLVGNDKSASIIKEELKNRGVNVSLVQTRKGQSGRTIILLDDKTRSTKIGYQGVCTDLTTSLDFNLLKSHKFTHIHLVSTHINTIKKVKKIAEHIPLSIDFGAKTMNAPKDKILSAIEEVDIVFMNEVTFKKLYNQEIGTLKDDKLKLNFTLIVTAGSDGAYGIFDHKIYHEPAIQNTKIVDTTGAGDANAAAILFAIQEGVKNPNYLLQFGITAATLKIQHYGGANGHSNKENILKLLKVSF